MSVPFALHRNAVASSSRLWPSANSRGLRALSQSNVVRNASAEPHKPANPRELIERQRKVFEEKYGDKLKRRVEAEGVRDLDALKEKVMAPSIRHALKSKKLAQEYRAKRDQKAAELTDETQSAASTSAEDSRSYAARQEQAKGDRAGIKPLSSVLNLDILNQKQHSADDIAKIWTAYHTNHPTLASSFLSAFLPASTYTSMITLAMENPFFVLPLPRDAPEGSADGQIKTDEYQMFYLQWLFHPTEPANVAASLSADGKPTRPPMTSSVIFTPLEEFKGSGEWAQPYLVLTHYPELASSHGLVLMRGEITQTPASTPQQPGAVNPGYLLSQAQSQLLALALQRFYCAEKEVLGESQKAKSDRLLRAQTLRDFRQKPGEWDWQGLVEKSFGGLI